MFVLIYGLSMNRKEALGGPLMITNISTPQHLSPNAAFLLKKELNQKQIIDNLFVLTQVLVWSGKQVQGGPLIITSTSLPLWLSTATQLQLNIYIT